MKLKAQDCRVGNNILSRSGNHVVVNWATLKSINEGDRTYSPILLTEDIYKELNFSKDSFGNYCYGNVYVDKKKKHLVVYDKATEDWFIIPKELKYLHELQNLYYDLTGETIQL